MNQRFNIKGRLMGRNEHDYLNRSHWAKGRKAKEDEQAKVMAAILAAKLEPMEGPVEVGVTFVEGKAKNGKLRDPDNIESVTVLKGAAATALYGSQAANGAPSPGRSELARHRTTA